jgi:hypothetical protein
MANDNPKGGDFKVFLLDPESSHEIIYNSPLSIYSEYGEEWRNFIANNTKPSQLFVSDSDVDTYDWKKQELTLTSEASKRLCPDPSAEAKFYQRIFFVALRTQRLYGGVTLEYISHVAAKVPVISFIPTYMEKDRKTGDPRMRRTLVIQEHFAQQDPSYYDPNLVVEPGSEITKVEAVKNYFSSVNKLS